MPAGEGEAIALAIVLVTFLLRPLGFRLVAATVLAIAVVAASYAVACISICTR